MNKLNVDILEDRTVPAAIDVTQIGTSLFIDMNKAGYVSVQQDKVLTNYGTFSTNGLIADVFINGSAGNDRIEVNLPANTKLYGGAGSDTLFGGTGNNIINGGAGNDRIYALLGNNVITSKDGVGDLVFTNNPAQVVSDAKDAVVRFFGPGRTPGSGFVGVSTSGDDAGTLYITPTNGTTFTSIAKVGNRTIVTYDFGSGLQVQSFLNVKVVAYFGGTGNDTYVNNSNLTEAVYGSAGDDRLVSGNGAYSLLKGSGGNDTIVARALENDVSTNPSATSRDLVFIGGNNNVVRSGVNDIIFGGKRVVIPQL